MRILVIELLGLPGKLFLVLHPQWILFFCRHTKIDNVTQVNLSKESVSVDENVRINNTQSKSIFLTMLKN